MNSTSPAADANGLSSQSPFLTYVLNRVIDLMERTAERMRQRMIDAALRKAAAFVAENFPSPFSKRLSKPESWAGYLWWGEDDRVPSCAVAHLGDGVWLHYTGADVLTVIAACGCGVGYRSKVLTEPERGLVSEDGPQPTGKEKIANSLLDFFEASVVRGSVNGQGCGQCGSVEKRERWSDSELIRCCPACVLGSTGIRWRTWRLEASGQSSAASFMELRERLRQSAGWVQPKRFLRGPEPAGAVSVPGAGARWRGLRPGGRSPLARSPSRGPEPAGAV
ncbi:hypothetical protein ACIRD3_40320, partial [Kitasatospora sp. NPDC093550]